MFSPEAFVAKQYTPFFYDTEYWYYGKNVETDDNNSRFNKQVIGDWDKYLNHRLDTGALQYLFFKCRRKDIDSVYQLLHDKPADTIAKKIKKLTPGQVTTLFDYLKLAKDCETFAIGVDDSWYNDKPKRSAVPTGMEESLSTALNKSTDPFIKERLWFQLVRFYFYKDTTKEALNDKAKIFTVFNQYKNVFPQNVTWYRTLGYVAGYYRRLGNYAQANYLYSRCYDFSYEMKIPSKFSFYAQEEPDWQQTLKLAKNMEERITLWHILGMEYDPLRAIKKIVALDPKSDKTDLLLSRMINARENSDNNLYFISHLHDDNERYVAAKENGKIVGLEIKVVDSIALKNNTAKPYYWNIAAGYLHYLHKDYLQAGRFYARAKKQLPKDDKLVLAQYKMLTIFLDISQLKRIDAKEEEKLVEPLNWLKNAKEGNGHIEGLRVGDCSGEMGKVYLKQRDTLKANCFTDTIIDYGSTVWVQKVIDLMNKPNKSAFETTMLKYYPRTLDQLYYHQGVLFAYDDDINKAIAFMSKVTDMRDYVLPANPFNIHINDCHDCDQALKQKHQFTALEFLKAMQTIQAELKAGKDKYKNALLLANAYYNISYYGNCRPFYGMDRLNNPNISSQNITRKYYLLARNYAQTNEQKAKCTFMASKCEHNDYYNTVDVSYEWLPYEQATPAPTEKYFKELKNNYSNTQYYREVLKECGYFRDFVKTKN